MFVTYTPDGDQDQAQRWEFKPGRVKISRSQMIEKRYSTLVGEASTYEEWKGAVLQGSAAARRVLLWHLLNLEHATLRIEDVDPMQDELLVEQSSVELAELKAMFEKNTQLGGVHRDMILTQLEFQALTAPDGELGKAPTSDDASPTGSTSPTTSTSDLEPSTS